MKNAPAIVVFGYSRDRALFEQAARAAARLVAKGEACAVRLYDDANDPMYPGGKGVPEGVTRVETRWDRTGLRTGARTYCEETVRGIVDSLRDAVGATGAEWAVKTDCDAALNSLAFLGGFDPAVYCQVGNEGAPGMSMGVLYAMSAAGLEAVSALLDDRKAQARLIVQDRPEAQSVSLLAQLSGMRRHLVPAGGTVGVGWRHSRHGFVDASPEQMDGMMKCLSVYFKPTMPQATPDEAAAAAYAAALRRMTAYVDALLERGDEMAPKPPPRKWSRLSLKTALAQAGMLAAARALLSATEIADGYTAWEALTDCDYIEEGYPEPARWSAMLDGLADALGKSRAEINAFLDAIPTEEA